MEAGRSKLLEIVRNKHHPPTIVYNFLILPMSVTKINSREIIDIPKGIALKFLKILNSCCMVRVEFVFLCRRKVQILLVERLISMI